MKKYLGILCSYLVMICLLGGCTENNSARNKRLQPERYFDESRLEMANAIHKNNKKKVERLLKQGVNVNELAPNKDGVELTYLQYAIFLDNRSEIVKLLLENKADPNQISFSISSNKQRHVYYLPLTYAASDQSIEYMKLLLNYGAKADYTYIDENGRKPLNAMYPLNAAVRSSYRLYEWSRDDFINDIKARINLLLENGADINGIGTMNNCVVESAISNPEIVLYLMDKGADHRLYGSKVLRAYTYFIHSGGQAKVAQDEVIRRLEALGYQAVR